MFKRNKVISGKWLLLLAGLIFFGGLTSWKTTAAYAQEQSPGAVAITGKVSSDHDMPKDAEFVIRISADKRNPNVPLPDITQVMVRKSGDFVFGPIALPEIGDYYYVITEDDGKLPGVTYDSKTVNVCVSVRYGEKDEKKVESIIVSNDGWKTKHESVEFTNSYQPGVTDAPTPTPKAAKDDPDEDPDDSNGGGSSGGGGSARTGGTSDYGQGSARTANVKTGDDTPITFFVLILVCAATVLVLAGKKFYKK